MNKFCKVVISTSLMFISVASSSYAAIIENNEQLTLLRTITKVFPAQSWTISQGYGWQYEHNPSKKDVKFHPGIDILANPPVYAYREGTVIFVGEEKGYGNLVKIKHTDELETWYGHLDSIDIKVGEKVKAGDLIAHIGIDSAAKRRHLHFEARLHGQPVDPGPYIKGASTWSNLINYIIPDPEDIKSNDKEQAKQAAQQAYEQANVSIHPPLPRCGASF